MRKKIEPMPLRDVQDFYIVVVPARKYIQDTVFMMSNRDDAYKAAKAAMPGGVPIHIRGYLVAGPASSKFYTRVN